MIGYETICQSDETVPKRSTLTLLNLGLGRMAMRFAVAMIVTVIFLGTSFEALTLDGAPLSSTNEQIPLLVQHGSQCRLVLEQGR